MKSWQRKFGNLKSSHPKCENFESSLARRTPGGLNEFLTKVRELEKFSPEVRELDKFSRPPSPGVPNEFSTKVRGWLAGQPAGRLAGWMAGRLAGWLTN